MNVRWFTGQECVTVEIDSGRLKRCDMGTKRWNKRGGQLSAKVNQPFLECRVGFHIVPIESTFAGERLAQPPRPPAELNVSEPQNGPRSCCSDLLCGFRAATLQLPGFHNVRLTTTNHPVGG